MRGDVRPTRGAHAAPRAVLPVVGTARPRHGRVLPGPLPALLIGLVAGGLSLGAAVAPAAPPATPQAVRAQSAVPPAPLVYEERREMRASRSTRQAAPEPEPEPSPEQAVAVPAPSPSPRPALPGCDGRPHELSRYVNGRLPASVLCTLPDDSQERLRADAAVAFARLAAAYQADLGRPLCVTDGYRTLGEQRALRRTKPGLAARPGTSEHGWGLALDLSCGVQSFRTSAHAWMAGNATRFGWVLPQWARRGGSKPEPWHWEYIG